MSIFQLRVKTHNLSIDGHNLLVFVDYSAEVTRQRKAFISVCFHLHHKKVKFTLAYPAILYAQSPDGENLSFKSPEDADKFLDSLTSSKPWKVSF